MFLSLVRPDRISSPITSTAAVMMPDLAGADWLIALFLESDADEPGARSWRCVDPTADLHYSASHGDDPSSSGRRSGGFYAGIPSGGIRFMRAGGRLRNGGGHAAHRRPQRLVRCLIGRLGCRLSA